MEIKFRAIKGETEGLNEDELMILRSFRSGEPLSFSEIILKSRTSGSELMDTIEKLYSLGYIYRDWESEIEQKAVVYRITQQGKDAVGRTEEK